MRARPFASPLLLVVVLLLAWPTPHALAADSDVSGRWTGMWNGFGIFRIAREQGAVAELRQQGAAGVGRLVFEGAGAAESVPLILRLAGSEGVPVVFHVTANGLVMSEPGGEFTIDFVRRGDALVGHVRDTESEVNVVLRREPPRAAASDAGATAGTPPPLARLAPAPSPAPEATPPAPAPVAPPPAPTVERPPVRSFVETAALQPIHFDFDRAAIRPEDTAILDANAAWLRANADVDVLIEGHCDERGTNEYNLALGERRARAARDYLVAHGIATTRLGTISYGEERPVCTEHDEACWSQNRRAVFRVGGK